MKLSQLYSNDKRFHNMMFNGGLNVVLGKISQREDINKDSHNLGKSTLIDLLDFMLLKEVRNDHLFKKYGTHFEKHVFYLEIILNSGMYLTIRRSVAEPTKISFKTSEALFVCNEATVWDKNNLSLPKAREYFNSQLNYNVLNKWSYRKTVSFFLRTQKDFINVFQLGKFINGKHKEWKPAVFELLGYDSTAMQRKYELDELVQYLDQGITRISAELSVNTDDYDKIKSMLEIRKNERDEMQKRVDAFSFFAEENKINQGLVEEIERKVAQLNTKAYSLSYDLDRVNASISNLPSFDLEQLQQIYADVQLYFPNELIHSLEDLYQFNLKVTKERNQYLREQANELAGQLSTINMELQELDRRRNEALAALRDKDTFHKFKVFQTKLARLEGDVSRLEVQLKNVDMMSTLNDKMEAAQLEQKEISKQIAMQLKRQDGDIPASLKRCFNEIYKAVFGVSALLYVRPNKTGNVEFVTEVAPDENAAATAEGRGDTYNKILCASFDLAVLATYSSRSFFRFVYHDGILEGLDNRKKMLFVKIVRAYCQRYGIQYIFSSIEDDIPRGMLSEFTQAERFLTLNDQDDSGKLFGFSF